MANSGAQVLKEAIVKAITILGTLKLVAKLEALSTKTLEETIIKIKPKINKHIFNSIAPPISSIP